MMNQDSQSVEKSLISSIADPGLNISSDLLELGINELSNNSAIEKIPLIGTLVGVGKGVIAVRDWLLVKNILYFLSGSSNADFQKRQEWVRRLSEDNAYRQKVGERLIGIVNKLNETGKNEIAGRIFALFLDGKIGYDDFIRLCEKLDRLYTNDFVLMQSHTEVDKNEKQRYQAIGLYKIHYPGVKEENYDKIAFHGNSQLIPNSDCEIIVSCL